MRPDVLSPLFAALTSLPGIGPKVEKLYARLFGREHAPRILDLLFHLPAGTLRALHNAHISPGGEIEKRMAGELEKRGKTVVRVDRKPFREATVKLHNGPDATWTKDIYDKLQKL